MMEYIHCRFWREEKNLPGPQSLFGGNGKKDERSGKTRIEGKRRDKKKTERK